MAQIRFFSTKEAALGIKQTKKITVQRDKYKSKNFNSLCLEIDAMVDCGMQEWNYDMDIDIVVAHLLKTNDNYTYLVN